MTSSVSGLKLAFPRDSELGKAPVEMDPSGTIELTRGLVAGDDQKFRRFHDLYFDRLQRYLTALSQGDETAARENLQETFIRVARRPKVFSEETALWSWLTVVARNVARDRGRKERSYWRCLGRYARDWMGPPAHRAEKENRDHVHRLLDRAIASLAPLERQLIERKYLEGRRVKELVEETQLSEKAVESRLSRARKHLREWLTKEFKQYE